VEALAEVLGEAAKKRRAPSRGGASPHAGTAPVETVPGTPDIP